MADLVIFGVSMSGQVAHADLERDSDHRVVGFTLDTANATSDRFDGLPLVPWERLEQAFPLTQVQLLGPISFRRSNESRRDRYLEGNARGYRFACLVHPRRIFDAKEVGEHCFILAGTTFEPYVTIGNNVIIRSSSHIGHDCVLGDYCFLSGQVVIAGATCFGWAPRDETLAIEQTTGRRRLNIATTNGRKARWSRLIADRASDGACPKRRLP